MTLQNPDVAARLLWALNAQKLIGRRIEKRMSELGLTDEALSNEAHVTVKTVWRLRNGKSYPRIDTAKRIATALSLPLSDLQPPTSPEDEPELRELLQETLARLQRIELAMGVDPLELAEDEADLDDEEPDSSSRPREAENA